MNRFGAWLALCIAFAFAAFGPSPAAAREAAVEGIRFSSGSGHTRVVIDLSAPAPFGHQMLHDPERIILDVDGQPGDDLKSIGVDDGLVTRVRVGTVEKKVRIVFDLKSTVDYRVFEVPADGARPHRLVVDLFGTPPPGAAAAPAPTEARGDTEAAPPPARKAAAPGRDRRKPWVIVVDAGHGGQDPGAQGLGLDEKDVCLDVARQLVNELNDRSGFRARLSRDEDCFLPLRQRTALAEKSDADAFVSIHANASRDRSARGTEVYFLSLSGATDEAARELAHLENSADEMGGIAPPADDDLSSILFDMQQTDVLQRGSLLAESVVNALRGDATLITRGVKQAGFVVLKSPRIPSILVETAFITNPQENRLLARKAFRKGFAGHVADGIVHYFQNVGVAELR